MLPARPWRTLRSSASSPGPSTSGTTQNPSRSSWSCSARCCGSAGPPLGASCGGGGGGGGVPADATRASWRLPWCQWCTVAAGACWLPPPPLVLRWACTAASRVRQWQAAIVGPRTAAVATGPAPYPAGTWAGLPRACQCGTASVRTRSECGSAQAVANLGLGTASAPLPQMVSSRRT